MSDSATPWTAERQASLSFTISWSLLKFVSIELVMPSNHFILCCLLLFLPSIFPRIRKDSSHQVANARARSISDGQMDHQLAMQCLPSELWLPSEHQVLYVQFSSVAQSCPTLQPHEPQHARPPCPSPTPRVHPNPCPLSW